MRARHRHLNPGRAGAAIALDARFITGLNDGDSIDTWSDISGNGKDVAGTGTARPTFQTAELGGNPVVRFDGSNDRLLANDSGMPTGNFTFVCIAKETRALASGQFGALVSYGKAVTGQSVFIQFGDNADFGNDGFGVSQWGNGISIQNSTQAFIIGSGGRSSSSYEIRKNGANLTTKTMTTGTVLYGADGLGVGAASAASSGSVLNGDIACVNIIGEKVSDALRRRLEHAAAFSFKLPCS